MSNITRLLKVKSAENFLKLFITCLLFLFQQSSEDSNAANSTAVTALEAEKLVVLYKSVNLALHFEQICCVRIIAHCDLNGIFKQTTCLQCTTLSVSVRK